MPKIGEISIDTPKLAGFKIADLFDREAEISREMNRVVVEFFSKGIARPCYGYKLIDEVANSTSGTDFVAIRRTEYEHTIGAEQFLHDADNDDVSVVLLPSPAYHKSDYILC